ncbi:unnamed protein product, partial [Polarella glacialis]
MATTDGEKKKPEMKTRVFFRWAGPVAVREEEVRIVGSLPELGSWLPAAGIVLSKSDGHRGCFSTTSGVLLPLGQNFEYRYAICCASGNGELIRWEAAEVAGQTPRVATATGRRLVLEDDDGKGRDSS